MIAGNARRLPVVERFPEGRALLEQPRRSPLCARSIVSRDLPLRGRSRDREESLRVRPRLIRQEPPTLRAGTKPFSRSIESLPEGYAEDFFVNLLSAPNWLSIACSLHASHSLFVSSDAMLSDLLR